LANDYVLGIFKIARSSRLYRHLSPPF